MYSRIKEDSDALALLVRSSLSPSPSCDARVHRPRWPPLAATRLRRSRGKKVTAVAQRRQEDRWMGRRQASQPSPAAAAAVASAAGLFIYRLQRSIFQILSCLSAFLFPYFLPSFAPHVGTHTGLHHKSMSCRKGEAGEDEEEEGRRREEGEEEGEEEHERGGLSSLLPFRRRACFYAAPASQEKGKFF